MERTIAYSTDQQVQGWTSFYSFLPEWMMGMNNYFYTWKNGNLYRHNVNDIRNNFYGEQYTSTLQTVLNNSPTDSKLFKALEIVGDEGWNASIETDIQDNAYIEKGWFIKKEGNWFAYLRNLQTVPALTGEYPLRNVIGIGRSLTVDGTIPSATLINFSISPLISIGSILSVGDMIYYSLPPYTTPILAGQLMNIQQDYKNNLNRITIDCTITGGSIPSINTAFIMFIKNQVAESLGIIGHYTIIDLENSSTEKVEIFALNSEIQKSYP